MALDRSDPHAGGPGTVVPEAPLPASVRRDNCVNAQTPYMQDPHTNQNRRAAHFTMTR
jgi:hypothetical protein